VVCVLVLLSPNSNKIMDMEWNLSSMFEEASFGKVEAPSGKVEVSRGTVGDSVREPKKAAKFGSCYNL